jgi:hypothetical protein
MNGPAFAVIGSMIVCSLIGLAIGDRKNRGGLGFWLGLCLSVVGIVIIALIAEDAHEEAEPDADVT